MMLRALRTVLGLFALTGTACGPSRPLAPPLPVEINIKRESGPIGTPHPFVVHSADPRGRWVALCQARADTDGDGQIHTWRQLVDSLNGDALRPYVVLGGGEGVALDDFYGSSADGEQLVSARDGELQVHHVSTGRTVTLRRADLDEAWSYQELSRAVRFDRLRLRIIYHRRRRGGVDVVVHELSTGKEVSFRARGLVASAGFSRTGDWILVQLVVEDTDGDGELDYSRDSQPRSPLACAISGPPLHYGMSAGLSDTPVLHVAPSTGGPLRPLPTFVHDAGPYLLSRGEHGDITAIATDGDTSQWAPPECEAKVLATSAVLRRALVACRGQTVDQTRIEIHGPDVHHTLATATGEQLWYAFYEDPRFAAYRRDDTIFLVDLAELREWPMSDGQRVVDSFDMGVVLAPRDDRTRERQRWFPATGAFEALPPEPRPDDTVFAETVDGRQLVQLHPPHKPKDTEPRPTTEHLLLLRELNQRHPLPVGPLTWRRTTEPPPPTSNR